MQKRRKVSLGSLPSVSDLVEKSLNDRQKNKEFKDVGTRVGGSRKEMAAYDKIRMSDLPEIEKDVLTAEKLVVKDKVYPILDIADERTKGVSSGAAYLKAKIRKSCAVKPANTPQKRASFVKFIAILVNDLEQCYKVDDIANLTNKYKEWDFQQLVQNLIDPSIDFDDEKVRIKVQGMKNDYRIRTLPIIAQLFGTSFCNMLFNYGSDTAHSAWKEAKEFEVISPEQSKQLIEEYLRRVDLKISRANEDKQKIEVATAQQLKGMYQDYAFYKELKDKPEELRIYGINSIQRQLDNYQKWKETIPENLLPRKDNWSWADLPKDRKEVVKSNERQINSGIPLSYIKRTGGIKIDNSLVNLSKITNEENNPVTAVFGFKSVQFGNWVKDNEATEHIRHFLSAAADLSEILDIDLKQFNQIGQLSIAFGARGKGKALAHYEAGRKIINLTKKRGDGSICHEWGHYLDNIILMIDTDVITTQFASKIYANTPSPISEVKSLKYNVGKSVFELMQFILKGKEGITEPVKTRFFPIKNNKPYGFIIGGKRFDTEVKGTPKETFDFWVSQHKFFGKVQENKSAEYQDRFFGKLIDDLGLPYYDVELMPQGSQYLGNSAKMKSDYWIEEVELFARAWEAYILDKLNRAGRTNNYLVSDQYEAQMTIDNGQEISVYPIGKERAYLFDLFENLIQTLKQEYNLKSFTPFSKVREDEFIKFDDEKVEKIEVIKPKSTSLTLLKFKAKALKIRLQLLEL